MNELWSLLLCSFLHPFLKYFFFFVRFIAGNSKFEFFWSTIWSTYLYGNTVLTKTLTPILTRKVHVYNWSPQEMSMKQHSVVGVESVRVYRHLVIITTAWGNHVPGLISLGGEVWRHPHPDCPFRINWWHESGTEHGFRLSDRTVFLFVVASFQNVVRFCVVCAIASANTLLQWWDS